MSKKNLTEILAFLDYGIKDAWNQLSPEERSSVSFWTLNRYMSSINGNREKQELAVLKTNEYYNRYLSNISLKKDTGHHELLWKLLCMCGDTQKQERHNWIKLEKKTSVSNKIINFLNKIYPNMKHDEVELLARISTKKELRELAKEHGIEKPDF